MIKSDFLSLYSSSVVVFWFVIGQSARFSSTFNCYCAPSVGMILLCLIVVVDRFPLLSFLAPLQRTHRNHNSEGVAERGTRWLGSCWCRERV